MSPAPPAPAAPEPVSVVGIGADGWDGLPAASRHALRTAEVLIGGARQLALLPEECAGARVPWPSPLRPAVPGLLAAHAGRRICVLASGDPMFYGIGRTLTEVLSEQEKQEQEPAAADGPPGPRLRILPHPSSVSYACARLGWPLEDTEVVTLVGRPTDNLARALYDGHRLLVLSAGAGTPAEVAALLRDRGFGPTRMRVLEQLGGPRERTAEGTADGWDAPPADPSTSSPSTAAAPGTPPLSTVPGLPTPPTSTTASSPSGMSAPPPSPRWRPRPANSCGTSAAAPAPSPSNGCARTAPAAPSAWSATPYGPSGSAATPAPSASPRCASSTGRRPPPWTDCRPRTRCSSAAG